MQNGTTSTSNVSEMKSLVKTSYNDAKSVLVITLSRSRARNAISAAMFAEIAAALDMAAKDTLVRAVVITGTGAAFSAGADIKELCKMTPAKAVQCDFLADWNRVFAAFRKPVLAAVNGLAFGGGFELALLCDIVHCSASASFALPEITLGTIPGAGGTQRLIRAVGKSRAFEMILTGDKMSAKEALERGVVSKIHDDDKVVEGTVAMAERIAAFSGTTAMMAKRALAQAEKDILDGIELEKQLYHLSFGTDAFREGSNAFVEKRKADFSNVC